jgi:methyl-accepting chemotaxis protein
VDAIKLFRTGASIRLAKEVDSIGGKAAAKDALLRDGIREELASDISFAKSLFLYGMLLSVALMVAFGFFISISISRNVTAASSQVSLNAASLAVTMSEHEKSVALQGSAVAETTTTVAELLASSTLSYEQADAASIAAEKSKATALEGMGLAEHSAAEMLSLEKKMGQIAQHIVGLSEQTTQIATIARLVGELASETNMLALNAAVEAARAGEHGAGFAVVASEIRKLADQTKQSAEHTNAIVGEIQKSTNSMVMTAEDGSKTTLQVASNVKEAAASFVVVKDLLDVASVNMKQVLLNSKQQGAALTQINEAMSTINNSAREMLTATAQSRVGIERLTEVSKTMNDLV